MGELTPSVVDAVSLERALLDVEAANLRVVELTHKLLDAEERIAKLHRENVLLKRSMSPKRRAEHILRTNRVLYALARRAKKMTTR